MSPAKSSPVVADDETLLIHDGGIQRKPTPLSKTQLFLLLSLVSDLSGGDRRKVGYYTRLLARTVYLPQRRRLLIEWGRSSDHIGRKPILLLGLAGSVVPAILFGPSRPICALVLRPFIGGVLSRPQDYRPDRFSDPFWTEYPYFPPCLLVAAYALISFFVTAVQSAKANLDIVSQKKCASRAPKQDPKRSLPLRGLLTRPVLVSVSSYAMLDMAAMAFIPLGWATPADLGRLVHNLAHSGLWVSGYGCLDGLIQFIFFPHVVVRLGPGRVFLTCDLKQNRKARSRNHHVSGFE
ncbi:hypothetical protein EDB89DRAFT_1912041 [Lactarius sanguifluus]|nr:hypothetical protein EDB89DRAFT_1912041 [Lactarius sanguifluus]